MARYAALDVRFSPTPDVELLEDLLHAELDAFEPLAIHEHDPDGGWRVFFATPGHRDAARTAVASALGDRLLELSPVDVEDEDWARRSQASLKAIRVGRITVAPPWDVPESSRDADPGAVLIVIDPSMGFGTGHHQTTRLCLELMQQIDFAGTRVTDVGTGSGVLALAAWKLGAAGVTAVDYDPDALQNARENIARNGGGEIIRIVHADLSAVPPDPADVVLANLTAAVLQRHAGRLRHMVTPGGRLIVSGFSPGEISGVAGAFGLVPRATADEGEWTAAMF